MPKVLPDTCRFRPSRLCCERMGPCPRASRRRGRSRRNTAGNGRHFFVQAWLRPGLRRRSNTAGSMHGTTMIQVSLDLSTTMHVLFHLCLSLSLSLSLSLQISLLLSLTRPCTQSCTSTHTHTDRHAHKHTDTQRNVNEMNLTATTDGNTNIKIHGGMKLCAILSERVVQMCDR